MKPITIAGCGPGSRDYLTFAVVQAVNKADLLVGPARLIDLFPELECEKLTLKDNYHEALGIIEEKRGDLEVVVLVTGDPGVHSFAKLVIDRLGRPACNVLPGLSAVQCAFALLKMSWDDALIFSCHGHSLGGLESIVRHKDKVAVLTGSGEDPARIARELSTASVRGKNIYLFENLSLPSQRVARLTLQELENIKAAPLNTLIIVREDQP